MKSTEIKSKFKRRLSWGWKQKSRTQSCPAKPLLTGKIVAITGGNEGIGLATVRGLLQREAEVIMLSRNQQKSEKVIETLEGSVHFVKLDLGDISTIEKTIEDLENVLNGRKIDILINNAGIASRNSHRVSPQGYEFIFAVNVLGHHVLFKKCHEKGLLTSNAQIIAVTGDLYIEANDCTPDYDGSDMQAYARSKVGVMWWAYECHRLFPEYKVNIVHPGVVPFGLNANKESFAIKLMSSLMLSPEGGAQTTLICATQPNIETGAYYHNTLGKVILPEDDVALKADASKAFWHILEEIYDKDLRV
ncbi:MAG: SDR family NAD(P)-dependent oxidoreductase [Chitinophagales bacterium]|nr:SDR family NAD(P)-dependent oxidoreductase [Chitinophagales bacterium]